MLVWHVAGRSPLRRACFAGAKLTPRWDNRRWGGFAIGGHDGAVVDPANAGISMTESFPCSPRLKGEQGKRTDPTNGAERRPSAQRQQPA